MRVAVIGAGLFGCTAAIHAARAGHAVTLFDKAKRIMGGATRANQLRFHRGYHYPRSPETVAECQQSTASFMAEYGHAVVTGGEQYYAVADGSRTSVAEYVAFMARHGLEYRWSGAWEGMFDYARLDAVFQVREARIDYYKLYDEVERRLRVAGVKVELGKLASLEMRRRFDRIIVAGYAGTNEILSALDCPRIELQYELVEKPIVRLPPEYRGLGVVVMDGPFGCIDPGDDGTHLMGHVDLAVHERWTGLAGGCEAVPRVSAFPAMRAALSDYLPFVRHAVHVSSYWVVRAVLPHVDATDARPTLVASVDDQVVRIFAGKLGHAVDAAYQAASADMRAAA